MPNPVAVSVSLNITADPAVTLSPHEIPVEHGETEITWTGSSSSPNTGFDFSSLSFGSSTPSCFSNLSVSSSEITIDDDNLCKGKYSYTLDVNYDGKTYSSVKTGPGGDMTSPTIHNK